MQKFVTCFAAGMMWFVGMADRNSDESSKRTSGHYSQLEEDENHGRARNAVHQLNERYDRQPNQRHEEQENNDQEPEESKLFLSFASSFSELHYCFYWKHS